MKLAKLRIAAPICSYTFRYLRNVTIEATVETKNPVNRRIPEATQTSDHVKNFVKLSNGAILESTNNLKADNNPVEKTQPIIAEKTPSSKNGSWIENEDAPTNFITPVSRRRLKAAIRNVLLINSAAVSTLASPIASAPSRSTANNLKNFSKILRWS